MLIFKKEKEARKLVLEHFAKTNDCLIDAHQVLEEYICGDLEDARESALKVRAQESEADDLKRSIRVVLFSGAFLPNVRSDVYRLVDSVDSVADKGETAAHFIINQSPSIPDEFQAELNTIFGLCVSCFHELRKGLKHFFRPKGEMEDLQQHVIRVGELETQVDNKEAELTREIFSSSMTIGEKIHLCQLLKHIAMIADAAEDAADELEFAAMKSVL
jgi:predicted phosphate transport protein (TIGR00153 family)